MAIKDYVPTQLRQAPCGSKPWLTIWTTGNVHLRMLIWFRKPNTKEIWRDHKGRKSKRKYTIWTTPDLCLDELIPGIGLDHFFQLPFGAPGATIWYKLQKRCTIYHKESMTPPIKYTYTACGQPYYGTAGKEGDDVFANLGGTGSTIPCRPFIDGDATWYDTSGYFITPTLGTYRIAAYADLQAGLASPYTGTFYAGEIGSTLRSHGNPYTIPGSGGGWTTCVSAFEGQIPAGRLIGAWWVGNPSNGQFGTTRNTYLVCQKLP